MPLALETGISESFRVAISLSEQYAKSQWPILLTGETGVGKELLARHIHANSGRSQQPFIPVNCAALPAGLFESELFGHERGAFSGALTVNRGMVRAARGGTLFLDEIGDLELPLQVKLLRLLDQGEVRAVGSQRIERVDLRVVAATNVDLGHAVSEGRFRLDLLERLSVLTLRVPSLRERAEDISYLARSFLKDLNAVFQEGILSELESYDWPGNVRQLKNVLVRASILAKGAINRALIERLLDEESQLTFPEIGVAEGQDAPEPSLADIEKRVILTRLRYNRGNRKLTAKGLGIAKSTLQDKLRKWKGDGLSLSSQ